MALQLNRHSNRLFHSILHIITYGKLALAAKLCKHIISLELLPTEPDNFQHKSIPHVITTSHKALYICNTHHRYNPVQLLHPKSQNCSPRRPGPRVGRWRTEQGDRPIADRFIPGGGDKSKFQINQISKTPTQTNHVWLNTGCAALRCLAGRPSISNCTQIPIAQPMMTRSKGRQQKRGGIDMYHFPLDSRSPWPLLEIRTSDQSVANGQPSALLHSTCVSS